MYAYYRLIVISSVDLIFITHLLSAVDGVSNCDTARNWHLVILPIKNGDVEICVWIPCI